MNRIALWLAFAATLLVGRAACAQDAQTVLARKCVGETTWAEEDCAAILHVLKRRGDRVGVSAEVMSERYGDSRYLTRPWVAQLEADCAQPLGWPTHLSWARHRAGCLTIFSLTSRFLRGELADPCGASNWGSRILARDVARAQRALSEGRWVLAACSTHNAFYIEKRVK